MLINLNEAFKRQDKLVAFNIYNTETLAAVLEAAEEEDRAVIVSFGESYILQVPMAVIAAMVKAYSELIDVPVVLHLDHSTEISTIKQAIDLGFTSVMYDGSKLPMDENIKNTKKVVELAKKRGVSVEAELGYLNEEDGSNEVEIVYTTVEDASRFINETKVDALAIAVGNAHGLYKSKPVINLMRIEEIHHEKKKPLVLHGSSGITKEILNKAFNVGIRKINVNTELALAGSKAAFEYIKDYGEGARFENVMVQAKEEMKKVAKTFLKI